MTAGLRLTRIFLLVALAAVLLAGLVVLQVLQHALAEAEVGVGAVVRVRGAVLATLLALGVILVGLALVSGRALTHALVSLRAGTLSLARGESASLTDGSSVAELDALAAAVVRLSNRVATREAELERERSDVAIMFDAISEGILRLDRHGRLLRANPAARAMLGLPATAVGVPITTHVRHAQLRPILQQAIEGVDVATAEISVDERRLIVSVRPLAGDGGAVIGFVDLTELRRLESVRRDFVANASHELKTPLTSIRGYVETLLLDDTLPEETRRSFLEVVQKNADRLQHIVDDLLDLSRLQSGGWRPELRTVNAVEIINDVWSACGARARERDISFIAPREPVFVHADPGGLRQVLTNLLDNALRYTPQGGRIEVATRTAHMNGDSRAHIQFEVRDSGAGIPSDALPRIFERFYRADPARARAEGGTGLGLSIAKHLVESMGGEIGADSELGKGTVIHFRLPAAL